MTVNYLIIGGKNPQKIVDTLPREDLVCTCKSDVVKFVKEHRNKNKCTVILEHADRQFLLDQEVRYCFTSSHHWGVSFIVHIPASIKLPIILKAAFDQFYVYDDDVDEYYMNEG